MNPRSTLVLTFVTLATSLAAQSFPGSIYTTDDEGGVENVFRNDRSVCFVGGPGPNAGLNNDGLPDGLYYFQVTDTSGATLLSADPITSRWVEVQNGVFADADRTHKLRVQGQFATAANGSLILKAADFSGSSNDEYKLWLTPQPADPSTWDPTVGNHGFESNASKTDNFKVRERPGDRTLFTEICGYVYYDYYEYRGDPAYEPFPPVPNPRPLEVPIAGWQVQLDGGTPVTTDVDGKFSLGFVPTDPTASYTVTSVVDLERWVGTVLGKWVPMTYPPATPGDPQEAQVIPDEPKERVDFGLLFLTNEFGASFARSKGSWSNSNGQIELAACDDLSILDQNGVPVNDQGDFSVFGSPIAGPNGIPDWREVINSLNLRVAETVADLNPITGTNYTVNETLFQLPTTDAMGLVDFATTFNWLRGFLVGEPVHGTAAYQLSMQFCAANLNQLCGPFSTTSVIYIDSPQTGPGVLETLEAMIVRTQGLLSFDCTANSGPQPAPPNYPTGSPYGDIRDDPAYIPMECRALIQECLQEWDGMNSEGGETYTKKESPPPPKY